MKLFIIIIILFYLQKNYSEVCIDEPTRELNSTSWIACEGEDFKDFQCRTAYFPRIYNTSTLGNNPKFIGTVSELQRRIVKGTPKNVVFLFSGICFFNF
jgi:hypothetical protein